MLKNRLILSAILMIAAAICVTAQTDTKIFRGYLSGTPIQMSLVRDGNKLSGTYFYTRIGKNLNLAGTIDASGNFKLKETDAGGKTTGEFSGKWTEDKNSNGASIEGEWRKPNSKNTIGFIADEQIIEFTNGAKLISKNFAENNKPKRFTITAEYPELTGVSAEISAKFNQLSKTLAMASVADFRKDMMAQTKEDLRFLPAGMSNYLDIGYSVEWATGDVISIQFLNSFFTGGVHPNYYTSTLSFDMKSGKEIKLADLFQPNSSYLKAISDYSIADLKTRMGEMSDDDWIANGAGADAENFKSWNLTKKGLMITFDPYQVAAYAAGMQTVIIPYSELAGVWRKDKMFAGK